VFTQLYADGFSTIPDLRTRVDEFFRAVWLIGNALTNCTFYTTIHGTLALWVRKWTSPFETNTRIYEQE
jgi:hypothetical protein